MKVVCDSLDPFYPTQLFCEFFNKYFNDKYIEELKVVERRCKNVNDIKILKEKYGALLDKKCDETFLNDVASAKEILLLAKDNSTLCHNMADEIQEGSVNFFSQMMGILTLVWGGGLMFTSELDIGAKTALLIGMYALVILLYKVFFYKSKNKEAISKMDRLYRTAITCMSVFESAVKARIDK